MPVVATFWPPVSSPGVSASITPSVNARPADGPPTEPESMSTFTGKSNFTSSRVPGAMPISAVPSSRAASFTFSVIVS